MFSVLLSLSLSLSLSDLVCVSLYLSLSLSRLFRAVYSPLWLAGVVVL